ncbi:hypothetical protein PXD04_06135 [Methanosphaera sp. ISO3-F5]|uniref:hypothetical protein n=1 Tax=Methanosphaera sp. ISO3-F5 TaxID=1452353 RepID=UPI002B257EB9|nr:hypothetical protein [Methanosphaera sp. ISO3-F5]WQH63292.1 hypothetical protein PXD04_06135 [Methanosphaera sp. ISO3-F5]
MDSIIKLEDIKVKEWGTAKIEFEVTDENGNPIDGRIAVKINQKTHFNTKVKDGKFSEVMDFSSYHNKEYRLDVIYGGNAECAPSMQTAKIIVEKADPIFISIKELQNACYRLKKWIEVNKKVPGKILIDKHEVTIGNLFNLLVTAVKNLSENNKDDIELKWVQTPSVSSETITEDMLLSYDEYIKITEDLYTEMDENKFCPGFVDYNEEKIGFMNLIYIYSTLITNSSVDNGLLSGVYVTPWKKVVA